MNKVLVLLAISFWICAFVAQTNFDAGLTGLFASVASFICGYGYAQPERHHEHN